MSEWITIQSASFGPNNFDELNEKFIAKYDQIHLHIVYKMFSQKGEYNVDRSHIF